MKKLIFLIVISSLLYSCHKEHNGKVVKDKNGNYYLLKYSYGIQYTIEEIDSNAINTFTK